MTREQAGVGDSGHGRRLSILAFRWVKGASGWSRGIIDKDGYDIVIPDCDPGAKLEANGEAPATAHPQHDDTNGGPASDEAFFEATANDRWQSEAAY